MDPSDRLVEILCPRCGEGFTGTEVEIVDRMTVERPIGRPAVRCPHCGSAISLRGLAAREDDLLEALHRG